MSRLPAAAAALATAATIIGHSTATALLVVSRHVWLTEDSGELLDVGGSDLLVLGSLETFLELRRKLTVA